MASFGVALRSTKPAVAAAVVAPPPRAETPPPPPPPEPLRLSLAPRSLRSAALRMLMEHAQIAQALHRELDITERNPMLGAAVAPSAPVSAAAAAAAAPPAISTLPSLDDSGTVVSGWVSCLRYLVWKSLTVAPAASTLPAAFYPLPAGLHTPAEVSAAIAAAMPVPPPQAPSAVAAARASLGVGAATAATPAAANSTTTSSATTAVPAPSTASAVAPPPPAVVTVSSFVIDSYLESLSPVDCALSDLTHCFLTAASRAPSASTAAGHVGFLAYKFDRDGDRIVPRWTQQQHAPPSSNKLRAASHPHAGAADGGETQHALERSLRTVHAFIADLQSRLAAHNPSFNAEKALALMRDTPAESSPTLTLQPKKEPPAAAAAVLPALPAVPEANDQATMPAASASTMVAGSDATASTPPPSVDPPFRFLLGTSAHTLADYVSFMLLQHFSLLHSFLPLLTPHSHPALFGFASTMERIYAPQVYRYLGPLSGLDGTNGRHSLLCRHPMLQIVHTPPAPPPPPPQQQQPAQAQPAFSPTNHNRRDTTVMVDPSAAAAAAAAAAASSSTLSVTVTPAQPAQQPQHAPSPTASPGPASQLASPSPSTSPQPGSNNSGSSGGGNGAGSKPFVPRLTSATDVASTVTRGPASSLAVEEVADLMDYVDQVAVRARAATPAVDRTKKPNMPAAAAAPAPAAAAAAAPVAAPAPAAAAAPMSSLAWSRLLSQRLLNAVDHASLGWKTVQERGQVRLLAPLDPNPLGDSSSYRSMAVSTFPVAAPVLLAFLWSIDCWKLLAADPSSVLEARELAPHPAAPSRARFSYLSIEMKSTSSTATTAAGAGASGSRRESDLPPPSGAGGVGVGVGGVTTKTSSARFEFVLLNTWRKRLDGSYVLLSQSVPEDCLWEINAPKKFAPAGKGCIRASWGGPDAAPAATGAAAAAAAAAAVAAADPRKLARFNASTAGCSGWVLRPFYVDGTTPHCEVTYLSCTSFPARMGSWVGGELERRTLSCMLNLRSRLKSLMGSHPLVQVGGQGLAHGVTHSGSIGGATGPTDGRATSGTIQLRLSQTVPSSLVNSVSGHGVQSTPHPHAKK